MKVKKRWIPVVLMIFLVTSACTTTKTIIVPPTLAQKTTAYDVYGVVLDTFQDLTIPVEFQDPPYCLETPWMYWPPYLANKILGFPFTWWKYRAIVTEKTITLEAEGRGLSLATFGIFVNFIPAPINWIAKTIQENLKTLNMNVKVETKIVWSKGVE